MSLKRNILRNLSNLPGWRTNRKIIVFESDDWGSIRMPSKDVFNKLKKSGIPVENNLFNLYDSLESNTDIESLFEVLSRFTDKNGNHPVFTGICVVANPDFEKIKEAKYSNYFFEPFTETLKRYPNHNKVHELWNEGNKKRLFVPQLHGREHLNVNGWLRDLQEGNKHTLLAFEERLWGITSPLINKEYQAAFEPEVPEDIDYHKSVIIEGIELFYNLLGYNPTFFVPPNGPFNLILEKTLQQKGIRYITLSKIQKEPFGNNKYKIHFRYLGKKNQFGQIYLSRNANFEPSAGGTQTVEKCLKEIDIAFKMKKPAIITTHRVNYIGSIESFNRDRGLKELNSLLQSILKIWPDVEFLTSVELGTLIENQYAKKSIE